MKISFRNLYKFALLTTLTLMLNPFKVEAQYFGRNKVMYDKFNFKILHTKHFDIYYYNEEESAVNYAASLAERWYTRHSELLQDTLDGPQALILYDGFPQFIENNVSQEMIGQGTGGFTEPIERRIVLPFAGPLAETDHVIGHELVHAFQFDITGKHDLKKGGLPAAAQMPLWFVEGMAEYLSIGPKDPNTAMWMREASQKELPDISDLQSSRFFPYRYGQSLLAFIGGKYGNDKIGELLRRWASVQNEKDAFIDVFHITPDSLTKLWHAALHAQYDSLAKVTSAPDKYGNVLISDTKNGGDLNISPSLSPDGKHVIFFSSKDLFSIDLFLADAKTGKIERNIFKTEFNTDLQNLEFIGSSGAFSPDGHKFVFAAVEEGRPVLTILDINDASVNQVIRFPKLAQIFNPAWSPDGRNIVFSALAGGVTNLFVYDLNTGSSRPLTDDAYTELQPAWSPDGKYIAFVTDRFTTKLSDMDLGNYQMALMDFETGEISELKGFDDGKNINPQWSHDGKNIFFISDHNGIDNIYRKNISRGKIYQITNLFGGVSGITAISPAMSVSADSNLMVYSVFQNNKYAIYGIDSSKILDGENIQPDFVTGDPSLLPPPKQITNFFVNNLTNPIKGLPSDTATYLITDYSPSLKLVGVGQPYVGAGVDPFGTFIGGGIALYWSDLLGNQNLATALQVSAGSQITYISGLVGYMNTESRLNWGGVIQQEPYFYTYYAAGIDTVNGQLADAQEEYIYQETDREVAGLISYPLSEASRVEFSLGYRNISFTTEVITQAYSLTDGSLIENETQKLPSVGAINLAATSIAYVFDNSYYGATGPLLGSRYRIEVSPNYGNITWTDILADYRIYLMPLRPFTIAARILSYGRYGKDAEDERLTPEFLGYPGLVRGYDINSYSDNSYTNIEGSKILVGNLEIRFPLLGILGIGPGFYGYFPVEFAGFYDTGVAWYNDERPDFLPHGDRMPVSSSGVGLRINLFGYAVGEVDYVHPYNHGDTKSVWEFNLMEGF